jgi:hypothetical protein
MVLDDVTQFAIASIATLAIETLRFIVAELCKSGLTAG